MKVHLLILLALAGPFCGVTRASPTGLPVELGGVTDSALDLPVDPSEDDHVVITGAPPTNPEAVPAEVATAAAPETATASGTELTPKAATEASLEVATGAATESATEAETAKATAEDAFTTQGLHAESTAPASDSPVVATEGLDATEVPVVETAAPTDAPVSEKTDTSEAMDADVVVDDEGLSSGQVVGVVIGVLIAVVFVIAVVIALAKRMGKYSP